MINEIKKIVKNYIDNAKLCRLIEGIVENRGIKITDKLIIPFDLVVGNLKDAINLGDKVRMIRNHGGQEFYILEVISNYDTRYRNDN